MSFRDVTVEIFAAGDGNNYPKKGNTVVVHYTGSLKDGMIWDSSRDRGKPFRFKLGADQVIPGKVY
jgi:FK506-binding protein 1